MMEIEELKNKIKTLNECQIWDIVENCIDNLIHSNNDLMAAAYENIASETLSSGYVPGSALKILAQRIKERQYNPKIVYIICDNGYIYMTDIDFNGKRYIRHIYDMLFNEVDAMAGLKELQKSSYTTSLEELSQAASRVEDNQYDIKTLRKRIKHCKNPLERKSLEKALNDAYKRRKMK